MLRTCLLLVVALHVAMSVANLTHGVDMLDLLQVWRPKLQLEWTESASLSRQCADTMKKFSQALGERQPWASRMMDATGRPSSEFLLGSDYWLGSRSECENFKILNSRVIANVSNSIQAILWPGHVDDSPPSVFRVVTLKINLSEPLVVPQVKIVNLPNVPRHIFLGICLPRDCGAPDDVRSLLELMIDNPETAEEQKYRDVRVLGVKVLPGEKSIWSRTSTILLAFFVAFIFVLVVIGTKIEISETGKEEKFAVERKRGVREMALSFSLISNIRTVFSLKSRQGTLSEIHGLKALTIIWVMFCHFCEYFYGYSKFPSYLRLLENDFLMQPILNGALSVHTFFFISGVLIVHTFLKSKAKKSTLEKPKSGSNKVSNNVFAFLYRIPRLLLPYAFTILFAQVIMQYWSENSVFEVTNINHITCSKYWWRNLLFINNFFLLEDSCVLWSWYIAVDLQLFLVGTIILLIYTKGYKYVSFIISFFLLAGSWILIGTITYTFEFVPTIEKMIPYWQILYIQPWYRIGPFLVGMAVGWILYRTKGKINMSKMAVSAGWLACSVFMILIVQIFYFRILDVTSSTFYVSLAPSLWAACMGWILVACTTGYGGWVSKILSLKVFFPISRVTYCIYLVNVLVVECTMLSFESPLAMSRSIMSMLIIGLMVGTFFISCLMAVTLEFPMLRLLSIVHPLKKGKYQPNTQQTEVEMVLTQARVNP